MTVYSSQSCDPNFPQIFCSTFAAVNARTCDAGLGSPLIDVDSSLAGFVISNTEKCQIVGEKFTLNYLSIGEFHEWIEEVSGAEKSVKSSMLLISMISLLLKNFL